MQKYAKIFAAALMVMSCDKSSKATPTSPGITPVESRFLTTTTFATVVKPAEIPGDKLHEIINKIDAIYAHIPGDTNLMLSADNESALFNCMAQIKSKLKNKSTLVIGGELDLADCVSTTTPTTGDGFTITFTAAKVKVYVEMGCEGGDLSSLAGKGFDELHMESDPCPANITHRTFLENIEAKIEMLATVQGRSLNINNSFAQAHMKADGTACGFTLQNGELIEDAGCQLFETTYYTPNGSEGTSDAQVLTKVNFSGRKAPANSTDTYYSAGTATLSINGWEGTLTYHADPKKAPTWTMTKNGVTQNGTFGEVPPTATGLNLMHAIKHAVQWHK